MGTARDWIWVIVISAILGALSFLRVLIREPKYAKKYLSLTDFIAWLLRGFWIGVLIIFRWNAFRWPLVLFNVALLIGTVVAMSAKLKPHATNWRDS